MVKLTSAASRCVIEQTRVIFIWLFFLMYAGTGHETFSWIKLGGFVLLVLGVLIFNNIITFEGGQIRFGASGPAEANSTRAI